MQNSKIALVVLLLFFTLASFSNAESQVWKWAINCSNPNRECEAWPVALDPYGNVYESGMLYNTSSIHDTITTTWGSSSVINYGEHSQVIVVSSDSNGTYRWALGTIDSNGTYMINIVTDTFGNIYLYGIYFGTMTLGTRTITDVTGNGMYFLAKINNSGSVTWLKNVASKSTIGDFFYSGGLGIDKSGKPYVSGIYNGYSITIGTTTLINSSSDLSTCDIFLAKFDTSGNPVWAKSYGGNKKDYILSLTVADDGSVYSSGFFYSSSITIGSNTITNPTSGGVPYIYLCKYNSNGIAEWAKSSPGHSWDIIRNMATDRWGNVYLVGGYTDTLSFGLATVPVISMTIDNFILKFDSLGNTKWGRTLSGSIYDMVTFGIAPDICGNIWVSGGGVSSISGDPLILALYDTGGVFIDSLSLQSGGDDQSALTVDNRGNLYIGGDYLLSPFNLGSVTLTLPVGVTEELFLAKYSYPFSFCPVGAALGLTEQGSQNDLSLYPNPVSNDLSVISNEKINNVIITNVLGQLLYVGDYNSKKVEVDVSGLKAGLYFININQSKIKKFVKE